MAESKSTGYIWFRIFLVAGVLLGVTLLVQSIRNYRMVSQRLIIEELLERATQEAFFLGYHANRAGVRSPEDLAKVVDEVVQDDARVAWIRIISPETGVIAASSSAEGEPMQPRELERGESPNRVYELRESSAGSVLVTLRNFRRRIGFNRPDGPPPPPPGEIAGPPTGEITPPPPGLPERGSGRGSGPRATQAEIAMYWDSAETEFVGVLRRNLIIQLAAAISLLGAMAFLGFRFQGYVRGKQLEQQLELARTVQEGLLPSGNPESGTLDVAALCDPAYQVGGDFYDVFPAEDGRVAMLLGDVSGKGLPAALLMGLLHGSVRSSHWAASREAHEEASRRLNDLLCLRTTVERFASMFWCYYTPDEATLRYVNAGHLPPFVVGQNGNGAPRLSRLDKGGPVLGVIPGARYEQGSVEFQPGDLFVLYSDGVVEAANASEEEFGEERLAELLLANASRPAAQIRDEIVRQVRIFSGDEDFEDDLTLLVVRVGVEVPPDRERSANSQVPELVRT